MDQDALIDKSQNQTSDTLSDLDGLIETLTLAHEQMSWLHSLFIAIKHDHINSDGKHVKNLSDIGHYLTETWTDSYAVMREDIKAKIAVEDSNQHK